MGDQTATFAPEAAGRRQRRTAEGGTPLDAAVADPMSRLIGHDVGDVRVSTDAALADGVAVTTGSHITFAPGEYQPHTTPGRRLIAHELTHVAQQRLGRARTGATLLGDHVAECQADRAAADVIAGGRVGSLGPVEYGRRQRKDKVKPGTAEVPVLTTIGPESTSTEHPGEISVPVTLRVPGFGDTPTQQVTVSFHKPVVGATTIVAYQVRTEDLYASLEAAEKSRAAKPEDRRALSIAGQMATQLTRVAAAITGPVVATRTTAPPATGTTTTPDTKAKPGSRPAANIDTTGITSTAGPAPAAGQSPATAAELAYDINGQEVQLVARSADYGITTEYTKIAVGAGRMDVLKTPSGYSLLDAGVRHDGAVKDPLAMDYAMKRLRELVPSRVIEEVLITHVHLDHIGMLDAVSREFTIKQITINAAQLIDPRFLAAAGDFAANQRDVVRRESTKRHTGRRTEWDANPELTRLIPDAAARDAHFKDWVTDQVAKDLATLKPVQVNVLAPTGSTLDAASVRIGGIELIRQEGTAPAGEQRGFELVEHARATIADPALKARYNELREAQKSDPTARLKKVDPMSSSYVMALPNGNQLLVLPDIRVRDIGRIQKSLQVQLARLGSNVEFRLWDMTHHLQSGFSDAAVAKGAATAAGTPQLNGVVRVSQLEALSEMLTELTPRAGASGPIDAIVVSVDPSKIDPALAQVIRACGLEIFTARGERDIQFIEARTAIGRKVSGIAGDRHPGLRPADALLRRTKLALDKLHEDLKNAEATLKTERTTAKAEKKAKASGDRKTAKKELSAARGVLNRATKAATSPGPRQAKVPLADRQQAVRDAQVVVDAKIGRLAELDAEITTIRQTGERLAPEVTRLKSQIKGITTARADYLRKIQTISHSSKDTTVPAADRMGPAEGAPSPFQAEELALDAKVRPVYDAELKTELKGGAVFGETSLIVLGKDATTDAGRKLATERAEIEALAKQTTGTEGVVEANARLLDKLQQHVTNLKARSDAADVAVQDEIAFLEQRMAASEQVVKAAAAKGTAYTDRDPLTGAKVTNTVVVEKTIEQAQRETATETGAPTAAEAARADPLGKRMQAGMQHLGRGLGAVMVYHDVVGAKDLLKRYGASEASGGELVAGLSKSVYGMNIGYRMARGAHVGMGEFAILSVLDIAQTALANYDSTEVFNTEVTYAIIRNAVTLACAYVGMALIETANPLGIIAGLAIMLFGDRILEALGIHDWLAKKFDFRPDEYIDLEKDLVKLIEQYTMIVGALSLQARTDAGLAEVTLANPEPVRQGATNLVVQKRGELIDKEREVMDEFEAAYERATLGYAMLPQLDALRAQFLDLYLKAHQGDAEIAKGMRSEMEQEVEGGGQFGQLTTEEVEDRFLGVEVMLNNVPTELEDIRKMEQWSKMDSWIGQVEVALYSQYTAEVDWMKVSEAERNLSLMVTNAHYRLDPGGQGSHRLTPIYPPGTPQRAEYERLLTERENKLDLLRARTVQHAIGAAEVNITDPGGTECEAVDNAAAVYCYDTPVQYVGADYGDVHTPRSLDALLTMADATIVAYRRQVDQMPSLPADFTAEKLHSDPVMLARYHDVVNDSSGYKSAMFALKASSIATAALVARVRQTAGTSNPADVQRAHDLAERLRVIEEVRRVDKAYLFFDETAGIDEKIKAAHATRLSIVFHDPATTQTTKEERAAAASPYLSWANIATMTDRLVALGVDLPNDPHQPISGVFRFDPIPAALIAHTHKVNDGYPRPVRGVDHWPMVAVNEYALQVIGSYDAAIWVQVRDLRAVTVAQLMAVDETPGNVRPPDGYTLVTDPVDTDLPAGGVPDAITSAGAPVLVGAPSGGVPDAGLPDASVEW